MNTPERSRRIEQLVSSLPQLDWERALPKIKRLSKDFHWFSPVLKSQLENKQADVVVRPRNEDELQQVVAACAKARLPLNVRGGGTGNYGQLVPLEGGVLVDITALNQVCEFAGGVIRAQTGIKLVDIEALTRPAGWELRCMPSTWRLATLGGLYCGGFGGIGSINYGPLAAMGNVVSVKVMTMEESPRVLTLPAPQALLLHHAYGSNGIILEVEIALAPAQLWVERLDVFDSFSDAMGFADTLARSPAMIKRQIAVMADPIPAYFTALKTAYQPGQHAVISVMASQSETLLKPLLANYDGRNAIRQSGDNVTNSLLEYCWNHTTLQALKTDKGLTYLQTAFDPQHYHQQALEMDELLETEVMSHIEFLRDNDGNLTCSGLQIVRYSSEERLNEIMQTFREHGVKINNPHVWVVEDGKQGVIRPEVVAVKRDYDPYGLLNPGKLRGWESRNERPTSVLSAI